MNKKDEHQRYRGENILINGLFTTLFGILPGIVILIVILVGNLDLEKTISPERFLLYLVICLLISGFLNTARLNSKYKKKQNL
jgi:ABC-type antimicrobial peptide transport system permease subunit